MIYSHTRPAQAVAGYLRFWLGPDAQTALNQPTVSVARCWHHGRRMLLQLEGVDHISDAELLVRNKLWIKRDDVSLEDDEYLWDDLIGMPVFDEGKGKALGVVRAVQDFGAQDTLLIEAVDGEWMIPFVDGIVRAVYDEQIHVCLPEGMDACFTPKF